MGKKRKSGHSSGGATNILSNEEDLTTTAKYDQDETFANSEDEFFAGKDQIMLEEGSSRKRRKQIEDEGTNTALVCEILLTRHRSLFGAVRRRGFELR